MPRPETLAPAPTAGPATPTYRSTESRVAPAGRAQADHASDYSSLAKRVKEAGLLDRRYGFYAFRIAALVVVLAVGVVLLVTLGQTWWQLLVAAYFGLAFTQVAYLTHDSAHRQMFVSGTRNETFSRFVGNGIVGLSYGWWMHKHSRHHANPNTFEKDGDIRPGALVFTAEHMTARTGLAGWLTARQGWYFFPILLLAGMDLHRNSILSVWRGEGIKRRWLEGGLLAVRLLGFAVLVFWLLGPVLGAAFMLVQLMVFGFSMGSSFAPNHKGMALIGEHEKVDYLRRQVLTSRNVTGGWPITIGMGALNYQIEHHLFPSMPSVNLRRARPLVRQHCAELGVPYVETSLLRSWLIVVQYLNRVGIKHADPFDCPAAAAFRAP